MSNDATKWLFSRAAQIVMTTILAAGTGIWQKLTKTSTWPEVILFGLVTFVCVLWILEKFWVLPLRWRLRQWLDDTGFNVKTVTTNEVEFRFVLTDTIHLQTMIVQEKPDRPILIAAFRITPTDEQLAIFKGWPQEKKDAFWRRVKMEFMRYGINFSDLTLESPGVTLSTQIMPSRELTSLEFTSAVLHVRSGARLYNEYLSEIK
jgi:hypothetical protein